MIDLIATILSILGAILNAKGMISGFYVWLVSNSLWMLYGGITNQSYIIATFFMYSIITLYGIDCWKKDGNPAIEKK